MGEYDEWQEQISLDYWRLCDELTINQAATLLVGCNPSGDAAHAENWDVTKRPAGYEAAKNAIRHALRRGAIQGKLIPVYEYDINGVVSGTVEDSINSEASLVEVDSLRAWLAYKGMRKGFFFPDASNTPEYLDPTKPRYAPKLAAAVRAWQAVTDAGGKHPKQALMKWLREHAAEFSLSDDEGKPNETGIEEVAKVANWQPGGGAPKTPGE